MTGAGERSVSDAPSPDGWLDRYAEALGVAPLAAEDVEAILDLARVVAHGTERKNAPLAAWLAGRSGHSPAAALDAARRALPPAVLE